MLGGDTRFVLSTAGHIAALVNPPSNARSSFRVNDALPESADAWKAGAVTTPGSWWTDHAAWLGERSGEQRPAPTELGSAQHPTIAKAPGALTVLGSPVDLSAIEVDSYVVAGSTDHICPWDSCYRSAHLLGGDTRFVLSTAGHIAALVNPPTNAKSNFRVNDDLPESAADWEAGAETKPGSWWTDHAAWLGERSGEQRPAPTELGSAQHPTIAKAPGAYVMEP